MADPKEPKPEFIETEDEALQREQNRRQSELDEQEDLNQGMSTGTHERTKLGVDWGPSYRIVPEEAPPAPKDKSKANSAGGDSKE